MTKAEKWARKQSGRGIYLGSSPAECVALATGCASSEERIRVARYWLIRAFEAGRRAGQQEIIIEMSKSRPLEEIRRELRREAKGK